MTRSTLEQLGALVGGGQVTEVLDVPLDQIEPDPEQPRKDLNGLEELAASISALGLQQPLWIRASDSGSTAYLLVAGERRFRAAQSVGMATVPCLLLTDSVDDPSRRLLLQLTENIQRRDLSMIEVAQALQRLLEELHLAKQDVARLLGKAPTYISKHLALLEASGVAREAIETGRLQSPETFRLFSKLPSSHQQALLERARRDRRPIRRIDVEDVRAPEPPPPPSRHDTRPIPRAISLRLTVDQAERLLRLLGGQHDGSPHTLKQELLRCLTPGSEKPVTPEGSPASSS